MKINYIIQILFFTSIFTFDDMFNNNFFQEGFNDEYSKFGQKSYKNTQTMIQMIIDHNKNDELTSQILQEINEIYNDEKPIQMQHVNSKFVDINLIENISAYSEGHFNEKSHGSKVTGYDQAKEMKRILVSGARGQAQNKDKINSLKLTSLGLSEIIERYRNGITAAFVTLNSQKQFFIDVKVHEDSDISEINEIAEWEISKSRGKKFLMHQEKTCLGVTKFFRLLIGNDYVRLISSDLTAGASSKDEKVISKSSIKINQQIAFKNGKKFQLKENVGYFSSENQTDKDSSKAIHKGWIKVQVDDGFLHKYTDAYSDVSKDKLAGDSLYDEYHERNQQ